VSSKIEGVPEGWELVRIGTINLEEWYVNGIGKAQQNYHGHLFGQNYVVIRKIEPAKPVYVPWTFDTCPRGCWVRHKNSGSEGEINFVANYGVNISLETYTFSALLADWQQLDGTPCGTVAAE
jgi:hypothetical protein